VNVPLLQSALNAISGRQATATARVPMQFAAGQISNIGDRLASLRSGAQGFSFAGLDLGAPGASQAALEPLLGIFRGLLGGGALGGGAGDEPGGLLSDRLGIYVTGTLRRGSESSTDAEEGFNFRNTGVTVGADYRFGTSYVMGLAGGFGRTTTGFDDEGSRLDAKHTSASLYGSYFKDHFHIDWMASEGHNAYGLTRELDYDSTSVSVGCNGVTCSTETTGSTTARQFTLSSSAGGDFNLGAFAFGPTLEVEYKQVAVNGFGEGGPSGLDLTFGGITTTSLLSKAGAYLSYAIKTPWVVILPQARVRYMHEFLNDQRTQSVGFAADTLPDAADRAFLIYTDEPDRDYIEWRASVSFQFPHGIAGFVDYGGTAGLQNISVHEFNIGLRLER
jgi:outer membrane lipase/esterase